MNKQTSFNLQGHRGTLTTEGVLQIARQALADGVPPEAERYKSWAVQVDDHWVGVTWLFGLASGIPRGAYTTGDVLLHFKKLGLTVEARRRTGSQTQRRGPRAARPSAREFERLSQIVVEKVGVIRAFLGGQSSSRPADEQLCDWVQFCYTFELYAEAAELFALVDPAGLDPWYFKRTKKLARISAMNADG